VSLNYQGGDVVKTYFLPSNGVKCRNSAHETINLSDLSGDRTTQGQVDGAVGEDTSHKVRQVEDVVVVVTRQHLQQTLQISTIFKLAPQVEQQIVGPL
jgi:hypothetical protein